MSSPPTDYPPIRLSSPQDAIAAIPYLLGFHPTDSLVCLAIAGERLVVATRLDLPGPQQSPGHTDRLAGLVARHATHAVLVGYGTADRAEPALTAAAAALEHVGLSVETVLRVDAGRFYCRRCDGSCPAEGTPYDPAASPVAAEAVYRGLVARPDRADLSAVVAPVTGDAEAAMHAATLRAIDRLRRLVDAATVDSPHRLRQALDNALADAATAIDTGQAVGDDDAAWLTVLISCPFIREQQWARCTPDPTRQALWADLTRRAHPDLAATPATLLATTAYLAGDGALAAVAIDRARQLRPGDGLAAALEHAIAVGLPPQRLQDLLHRHTT